MERLVGVRYGLGGRPRARPPQGPPAAKPRARRLRPGCSPQFPGLEASGTWQGSGGLTGRTVTEPVEVGESEQPHAPDQGGNPSEQPSSHTPPESRAVQSLGEARPWKFL
ncbi:uncharacterized protein LOC122442361 [Cervus canadensis]|uniref:uncharacterized protein LOC122442361 n=1 Tax=Cervus canadensis TaxID=1574408 RepID=UPI001C9E569B|nr:uncharacterized protein LOC122442361 [Cervus canadensis]